MKYDIKICWLPGLIVAGLMMVSACGGRSLEVSYYSLLPLNRLHQQPEPVGSFPELRIGVGPVQVPEALKRSQIVTRVSDHRFTYAESHRWAGDIEKDIARVIGENISSFLGTEYVGIFPWTQIHNPAYRVLIDIQEFDGVRGGDVVLHARWVITTGETQDLLVIERTLITEPTGAESYDDLVSAQSKTLAGLSREICMALAKVESAAKLARD